jgi:hypothetical protein
MKTLKEVTIEPVFVEYMPEILEECKLYISEEFSCATHKCLCGCGLKVHTPLGKNEWQIQYSGNKVSMTPSISCYQFACQSHYIITNNVANFV